MKGCGRLKMKKIKKIKSKRRNPFSELSDEMKNHKVTFWVFVILRLVVIGLTVFSAIRGQWENVFTCVLTLILFLIPAFVEKSFRVNLPSPLEVIVLLFVFAAQILGEIQCYYIRYPLWDTMLHTVNGFIFAAAGFALVDVLNQNDKIKFSLRPVYMAIVAFCFSMTVGVLWEFFEYFADFFLHTDMQKDRIITEISSVMLDPTNSNTPVIIDGIKDVAVNGSSLGLGGYLDIGLHDTMKDLLVNFIGAVVFSVIGFIYVKSRGKKKTIAAMFIPTLKPDTENKVGDAEETAKE